MNPYRTALHVLMAIPFLLIFGGCTAVLYHEAGWEAAAIPWVVCGTTLAFLRLVNWLLERADEYDKQEY